jgi:hypothetical protein
MRPKEVRCVQMEEDGTMVRKRRQQLARERTKSKLFLDRNQETQSEVR